MLCYLCSSTNSKDAAQLCLAVIWMSCAEWFENNKDVHLEQLKEKAAQVGLQYQYGCPPILTAIS